MYSAPFYSGWNGSRLNGVKLAVCRGLQNGMACIVAAAGGSGMEWNGGEHEIESEREYIPHPTVCIQMKRADTAAM